MRNKKNIVIFLVVWTFFILRYLFDDGIAAINDYASYAIEVFFVMVIGVLLRDQIKLKIYFSKKMAIVGASFLVAGFAIYAFARSQQILIPFEFKSGLTVFLLLIVAPVLEELLFRFILIGANAKIIKNQYALIALSAGAFSLAHFNALRYVPDIVRSFVIYQGVYTFLLGAVCASVYLRTNKQILNAIGLHFLFNLGFYLASLTLG
jgi:membrane protease YdiL (CAAX protease family)